MKIKIKKLDYSTTENRRQMACIKNCRLHIFHSGETILENLMDRHNRPFNLYKKVVVPVVLAELKKMNVAPRDFSWSQKAGCSCGCSPGFRFSVMGASYDIYVDVTAADFEKFIQPVQLDLAI